LLRKKDGGEWYLKEWRDRNKAENMAAELSKGINYNSVIGKLPKPELPEKLIKEFMGDKTILNWKNKLGMAPVIFGAVAVFIGGFAFMLIKAVTEGMGANGSMTVPVYLIMGFIILIFLLIVYAQTRKMIKNATTAYSISVGRNDLEYIESDKRGNIKFSRLIPLRDVYSIVFSHRSNEKNAPLYVLTKEQAAKHLSEEDLAMKSLKDLFGKGNEETRLDIEGLNAVECLQLENWLQELILSKSEIKVI
jgi:hypothetical protein